MKKRLQKLLMLIAVGLYTSNISAQFILTNPPATISTSANNTGVGIGNFPLFTATNARLHVNNFFCNSPNGGLNGFLLRSDGNQAVRNRWQFFTGTTAANATEKGILFTDPFTPTQVAAGAGTGMRNVNVNHFTMQSTLGDIIFSAGGANHLNNPALPSIANERMRITAGYFDDSYSAVPVNFTN